MSMALCCHLAMDRMWVDVMHCLGVCPDPGFGFRVGVPESGVGLDGASVSRLLCRLNFRVWYLAIGRGRVAGRNAVHGPSGAGHSWVSACRHADVCVGAGSRDTLRRTTRLG